MLHDWKILDFKNWSSKEQCWLKTFKDEVSYSKPSLMSWKLQIPNSFIANSHWCHCLLSATFKRGGGFWKSPPKSLSTPPILKTKHFPVMSRSRRYRGRTLEKRHRQCTIFKLPSFETITTSIQVEQTIPDYSDAPTFHSVQMISS